MTEQTAISAEERIACTILASAHPVNEDLAIYLRNVTSDPEYSSRATGEWVRHIRDDKHPLADYRTGNNEADRVLQELDLQAYLLATAVAEHRRNGRQTVDYSTELGYGFATTSSLAAEVSEYVTQREHYLLNAMLTLSDRAS